MLRTLFEQSSYPVFQNRMYKSAEEGINCPKGDIRLVESLESGLVFNVAYQPELVTYDGEYQNEQGLSECFRQHLDAVAGIVGLHLGHKGLVEVGCGKGFFLEMLLQHGFGITGFDETYEGSNPRIRKQYYGPGTIDRAEGLILRHVLEHVKNPFEFLAMLRDANENCGRIYIEVPCFDWICSRKAWFDVFYEHVNYFRISDFRRMFSSIVACGHLFGGQYLYVVADLSTLRRPVYDPSDRAPFPDNFTHGIDTLVLGETRQCVVWGGASKGVIFSMLKIRAGQSIYAVVDINPAKQGKFLPATGICVDDPARILPRLDSGATIFVMNSNYTSEIKAMSNNAFKYVEIDHG